MTAIDLRRADDVYRGPVHALDGVVDAVRTLLPKTNETLALLDRWLLTDADRQPFETDMEPPAADPAVPFGIPDREAWLSCRRDF